MKNLAFILVASVVLVMSCTKEGDLDVTPTQPNCNCGTVQSDRVSDYSVVIKSDCSGNNKRFYLSQGDWMNAHPGHDFCITNSNGWKTTEDTLTEEEALEYKRITE